MSVTEGEVKQIFKITEGLQETPNHYCPGCAHGIVHRLIGEVLTEMGLIEDTIGVIGVGCSVLAWRYFNMDCVSSAHGRAPAVATGIKRAAPTKNIFTYQGDGDLAAIGLSEIMHAAMRGEKFTTILYNNAIYGMTGSQMSPTSLVGQVTSTSPFGRDATTYGSPMPVTELVAMMDGAAYVARATAIDVASIAKCKKVIRKAFEVQQQGLGFSMVEVVGTCPTGWGITPNESMNWARDNMLSVFPLGELRAPGLPKPVFTPADKVAKGGAE